MTNKLFWLQNIDTKYVLYIAKSMNIKMEIGLVKEHKIKLIRHSVYERAFEATQKRISVAPVSQQCVRRSRRWDDV